MGIESCECHGHVAAILLFTPGVELWISQTRHSGLVTIRPAVIRSLFDRVHGVGRFVIAQVIRTHVSCVKLAFKPMQADGIAQTSRKPLQILTVGIHLKDAGADFFLLFSFYSYAAHRDVDLAVAADSYRA